MKKLINITGGGARLLNIVLLCGRSFSGWLHNEYYVSIASACAKAKRGRAYTLNGVSALVLWAGAFLSQKFLSLVSHSLFRVLNFRRMTVSEKSQELC